MKISAIGEASARMPVRTPDPSNPLHAATGEARVELTATLPDGIPDAALDGVRLLLYREAHRLAEVSAVQLRDVKVNRLEAERIRQLPPDRPAIIVGAGAKDLDIDGQPTFAVVRGEFKVRGQLMGVTRSVQPGPVATPPAPSVDTSLIPEAGSNARLEPGLDEEDQ